MILIYITWPVEAKVAMATTYSIHIAGICNCAVGILCNDKVGNLINNAVDQRAGTR